MSDYRAMSVPDGLVNLRADVALSRLLGVSRSAAANLAEEGHVMLDGVAIGKSFKMVEGFLEVTLPDPPQPLTVVAEPVPGMHVVYADNDIVVVDKPAGVAAHPSLGWTGPTVVGGLAAAGYRVTTSGPPERKGIVHRLDAGTSGLMGGATSEHAYSVLKQAFRDRTVEKTYHAIVQGYPDPLSGTIDAPIGRHTGNDWRFCVRPDGKPSITHYDTVEVFRRATLLDVHLETGRTHQIRVHFSALHHPCVGDPTYGADPTLSARLGLERQWLHAKKLGFVHPADGRWVEFESDYPADLARALYILREES